MTTKPIISVCFTYALPEGLWVEYADETRLWLSFACLTQDLGEREADRLCSIATRSGWTGMWHDVPQPETLAA